jgi:hypothetical protein
MRRSILATLALAAGTVAGSAGAETVVSANITVDTNWGSGVACTAANPIVLDRPIFVKDGATLTIQAGCLVRGQPRSLTQVPQQINGTPGALVVTQTGRLVVAGTAQSPVVFTTAATDNDNNNIADDVDNNGFPDRWDPGDTYYDESPLTAPLAPLNKGTAGAGNSRGNVSLWGGVVILGNAPTNLADRYGVGYGKGLVEGLTVPGFPAADATYGGVEPHDNSGSLRYLVIRHAGDEIGEGNELNGLTLAGVGDGTLVDNVEVYANFDDGIEWFGGTVHGKRLAVFMVGDDMFDLDEGYTGINQFLFGVAGFFNELDNANCTSGDSGTSPSQPYGSASGDKAGEFDGDQYNPDNAAFNVNVNTRLRVDGATADPTPWPLSYPAFYNMTIIGATLPPSPDFAVGGNTALCSAKRGIQVRNGFAGMVFNSMVVNTGTEEGLEVDPDGGGEGAPGFGADANALAGHILLVCSTFDDSGALDANENAVVTNGNAYSEDLRGVSPTVTSDDNVLSVGANPSNLLTKEDQSFDPTGTAQGKLAAALKSSPINPRPTGFTGVGGCVAPRGPGLDASATYRGAFPAGSAPLWTTGWTTFNRAGLLAN